MFSSSVAGFYSWLVRLFYSFTGPVWSASFRMFCRLLLPVHSEIEKIVHRMPEILLAAKIALCGLNRCVPEQELNLLNLTAPVVTQFRTSSAQVVRCNMLQAHSFAAGSYHVPDNILRDARAPYLPLP